jgi:hypothetical protein
MKSIRLLAMITLTIQALLAQGCICGCSAHHDSVIPVAVR